MKVEFRPSSPADIDAISVFCRRVLSVPASSPMFEAPLLRWKYWQPWPTWPVSRSYVLARGEQLLAHCAVMPLSLRQDGRDLILLYPFDWAAEPTAVGSGAVLLQSMMALADGMVIVGGSPMTQRMAEPLGFRPLSPVTRYSTPREPRRRDGSGSWPELRAQELAVVSSSVISEPAAVDGVHVHYPPSVLNEWLACPSARIRCYEVSWSGSPVGAVLLAFTPGQARLLELWPSASDGLARVRLIQAARALAGDEPGGAALVAMANTPADEDALKQAGLHPCGNVPMFAYSRVDAVLKGRSIRYQLLHGDMGFLHHGHPEVWLDSDGPE